MLPQYHAFMASADRLITDQMQKSRIIAAAIAVAVATRADMPSSPVDNPSMHFNAVVLQAANTELGEVNENLIFDCKLALEYARTLWLVRYGAAHPISRPLMGAQYTFFEGMAGVPLTVAPEVYEFCNKHKQAILMLAQQACELFERLHQVNDGRFSDVAPSAPLYG